jgi:DNA-binding response OmpR family regulator
MKTPLWDIDPTPTLLFDPEIADAKQRALQLTESGAPVEIATSTKAMLAALREKYFRTIVVAVDLGDADCRSFLKELRLEAPASWIIAIGSRADAEAHAVAHHLGVDSLLAVSALPPELLARIAALQLRPRPRI